MNIEKSGEVRSFSSPKEFSDWLEKNHATAASIWVRFYKKGSGKTGITYDQALDEALCYGWIDGIVKKYDDESYIQRFTPRRPQGNWSKRNTEHIARLTKEGRMRPAGLVQVEAAKKDGRWERAYSSSSTATVPQDFLEEIAKNKKAHIFYKRLNKANLYAIAYRLQTAKNSETYKKRKEIILDMLEKGEKFH